MIKSHSLAFCCVCFKGRERSPIIIYSATIKHSYFIEVRTIVRDLTDAATRGDCNALSLQYFEGFHRSLGMFIGVSCPSMPAIEEKKCENTIQKAG